MEDRDLVLVEALLVTLRLPLARRSADALCREFPDVTWFPRRGQSIEPAKQVCRRCLVRAECAAFALDLPDVQGVWGSTSDRDRTRARVAGISGADLLEWLDRPKAHAPAWQPPTCARCGGPCSRNDAKTGDGWCWACRPSLVALA